MNTIGVVARKAKKYVVELNLFENEGSRADPFHLRTAVISTRVYLTVLTIAVTILVVFTSFGLQSTVVPLRNPSQTSYEGLLDKNVTSLSCPCSRVIIPHGNFTWTSVQYHPVCSSIFVSDNWINHLFNPNVGGLYQGDFRTLASSYFQLLTAFCLHVNRSIGDAQEDFQSETLLTPYVLLPNSLAAKMEKKSQFLQLSINNRVRQLLELVRSTTQADVLQTAFSIPTKMNKYDQFGEQSLVILNVIFVDPDGLWEDACFCAVNRTCSVPSRFFGLHFMAISGFISPRYVSEANVSGFIVGCSALESLLQSTLECLFDSSCLQTIHAFIPSSNITGVYTLNRSRTRFDPKTSVEILMNELFVEEWSMNHSFPNYYAQCAPMLCTYTIVQRNDALYVFITLLGFEGGLTAVLHFCVPFIVAWWRKRRHAIPTESRRTVSYMERLRVIWRSIRVKAVDLNLFKTPTMRTDPFELTTLTISTRIYLILLCLSMIIILLFTLLNGRIESKTVGSPSLDDFEDLQKKYSRSLECACEQIAIPHHSFLSISALFHPVCTSFFTSNEWLRAMAYADPTNFLSSQFNHILSAGSKFFTSLRTYCILMETIVSDTSFIFNQSSFITDQVITHTEFIARGEQILTQFKLNTVAEANRTFMLIFSQTTTMYTTGKTDVTWSLSHGHNGSRSGDHQTIPAQMNNCSCALDDRCKQQLALYNYFSDTDPNLEPEFLLFNVPNMFLSCFASQSLLQSSLQCFFDPTCADPIVEKVNGFQVNTPPINSSILKRNSTRFPPNMLLEEIIGDMMIETWVEDINYSQYYEQCAPKLCTYFVTSHNDVLYVFTTMIGLFGGLSVALRIIVPRVVTWIRKRMHRRAETNSMTGSITFRERVHAFWHWSKTKILELNLFESEASWDDEHRRRFEIITTRIYLLLLMFATVILIAYTAFTVQSQSFTVKHPKQSRFEQLVSHSRYAPTLDCPCQNISIPYNSFMSISPQYHQLCSSDFVIHQSAWINLVYHGSDSIKYSYDDYRRFVVSHFRLLFYLCTLANDTLTDTLSTFLSSTLVSTRAQPPQAIQTQMVAAVNQFNLSIPKTFLRKLDFIRQMAQGNGLVSSISSNWYVPLVTGHGGVPMASRSYGANNCSCGTNSMCVSSTTIDGWIVPGFLVGCYPLESLLRSTLQCLYDVDCINRLKNPKQSSSVTIRPLNSTLTSPNITVQSLVNVLMVDQWESDVDYGHYYAACAPRECTYVLIEQLNKVYTVTTIIALFGGLTVVLKVIVPILVKTVQYLIMCRRSRMQVTVATVADHE